MIACGGTETLKRKHSKTRLCLTRQIPIVNKDIFKGDTLLPYVSSSPVWHPLKDGEEKKEKKIFAGGREITRQNLPEPPKAE